MPPGRVIGQMNRLTEYQRNIIRYHFENGRSADEIVGDRLLKRTDGTPILKCTVQKWINRFEQTGGMETKKRSGRKRILNEKKERRLIDYIKANNKMVYSGVKKKTGFSGHLRSLNRYAQRNNISMNSFDLIRSPTVTHSIRVKCQILMQLFQSFRFRFVFRLPFGHSIV